MPSTGSGSATAITSATFTYDLSTVVGKMRLLICDADSTSYTFTDAELQALYDMLGDGNIWNAAATACENQARTQLTISDTLRTSDGTMSKRRSIAEWRALACDIRQASLRGTVQTGSVDIEEPNDLLDSYRPEWREVDEEVVE
jgi:hypothetical protein